MSILINSKLVLHMIIHIFFLETLINLGLRFSRDFIELKVRKWEKLTFPIANSPLSKKNSTPRKRKNTPKPETPMPISVH